MAPSKNVIQDIIEQRIYNNTAIISSYISFNGRPHKITTSGYNGIRSGQHSIMNRKNIYESWFRRLDIGLPANMLY